MKHPAQYALSHAQSVTGSYGHSPVCKRGDTAMKRAANPSGQSEPFAIHASGLCKQVSPRKGETITLLENVEFTASWRALTGIIGPSGSGKSTLLYCLAGLEPVSSGQVEVLGRRISAMGPAASARFRRVHLGFVFQSYNLVPSMSVEDNLKLPFILRKTRWPEDRAFKLLDRLGIRGLLKANVTLLSGGRSAACGSGPCAAFGSRYHLRR